VSASREQPGGGPGSAGRPPAPRAAPRTVAEMRVMAREFLERQGIEGAQRDADLLLAHAFGIDRLRLLMRLEGPVEEGERDRARELLVRRGKREPVAYLTGEREFYGRGFAVGRGCLVPRPETELLVDLSRDEARQRTLGRIADVGTGSGALAVTLALEVRGAAVEAVDLEEEALAYARRNAEALGASVEFALGDGLEWLEARGPFDLVVSNPPYIDPAVAAQLAPEVREWEPAAALFSPAGDRDLWVRELCVRAVGGALAPGGLLLVELGFDQGPAALEAARAAGLEARLAQDLEGIDRVLAARRA
jgi:release factor glutamine methyltransferase